MDTNKIAGLIKLFQTTDVVTVDDSPLLNSWGVEDFTEFEHDDEVLNFKWTDEEGLSFEVSVTAGNLNDATVQGKVLLLNDAGGEPIQITCYTLTADVPTW